MQCELFNIKYLFIICFNTTYLIIECTLQNNNISLSLNNIDLWRSLYQQLLQIAPFVQAIIAPYCPRVRAPLLFFAQLQNNDSIKPIYIFNQNIKMQSLVAQLN